MLRQALGLLILGAFIGVACTNDYGDLAYVPEETSEQPTDSCNNDGDCDGAEQCTDGQCYCGGGPACSGGETCCPGRGCRDLDVDPEHCGGCWDDCPNGMSCNNGMCIP